MVDIKYITNLAASLLDIDENEIKENTKIFVDLEMDSMTFMEMIYQIEKDNNIKIELQKIKLDLTISDMVDSVNQFCKE